MYALKRWWRTLAACACTWRQRIADMLQPSRHGSKVSGNSSIHNLPAPFRDDYNTSMGVSAAHSPKHGAPDGLQHG